MHINGALDFQSNLWNGQHRARKAHTIVILSIQTDRPEQKEWQTVQTQIRCHSLHCLLKPVHPDTLDKYGMALPGSSVLKTFV